MAPSNEQPRGRGAGSFTPDPGSDVFLARLLAELTDRVRSGDFPDVEELARRHPALAGELRDLWAAAWIAEDVARGMASAAGSETQDNHDASPGPRASANAVDESESPARPQFGGCVLLEELGRGGMGVVYRARQPGLGRVVALKRLLRGEGARPQDLARFRAEAESAARLDHPHIVPVYTVDEHEGEPFFLMKFIAGTTLAKRLAEGPMPAQEAAALLSQVCRAVHYAHGQGVLHRDLKPSNILIDREGQPHVSDFGLAKRLDADATLSLTQSGAVVGTPSFMAPEQAQPQPSTGGMPRALGPACDVYSLGAILYQMLTGRPPFQAATPLDTILLVLEQDPVPPRVLNPRAPADLEMIALKCLQKSPEQRYASAAALADDLDAFLAGQPVSARSTSLRALASRLLGETHHAAVMENWGLLWICHSIALVVFYGVTNLLVWRGVAARWPYVLIFTAGLGAWAGLFWSLRRRGGPISFVERQLAHVWGAGVIAINLMFLVEWLMKLPVLSLLPALAITNGMLFMIKAGILSGAFYLYALLTFLAIFPVVWYPRLGPLLLALPSAFGFFATGLDYHRRLLRSRRLAAENACER